MQITLFLTYSLVLVTLTLVFVFFLYNLYAIWKGAPFVPSSKDKIKKMLSLAEIKKEDKILDIGSGDGRVLLAANKSGAKCVGVEISPVLYWWSRLRCAGKNIKIYKKDFWNFDISDVNILMVYCIPGKMKKLEEKIKKEMKPGSKIISNGFKFPDWQYTKKDGRVYLYIINHK